MDRLPSPWSDDIGILFRPVATYQEAARDGGAPGFGRLLLLTLVLGCAVSLGATGRVSVRVVLDGILSFAFLPTCCLAGFAVVYFSHRARSMGFRRAADLFFIGQLPWLLWLLLLVTITTLVAPTRIGRWLKLLEWSLVVPSVWSSIIDFHFFRQVMSRTSGAAVRDVILYRAIAWGAATTYFFGIALWYEVVPVVIGWLTR